MVGAPEECDCPNCAGAQPTPEQIGDLLPQSVDIDAMQDPMEVEIAASMLLAIGAALGDDFDRALQDLFVPTFEAQATPAARAMLAGIASVADGEVRRAGAEAARRLADAGVDAPPWLAELDARSRSRSASASPIRRARRSCWPAGSSGPVGATLSPSHWTTATVVPPVRSC